MSQKSLKFWVGELFGPNQGAAASIVSAGLEVVSVLGHDPFEMHTDWRFGWANVQQANGSHRSEKCLHRHPIGTSAEKHDPKQDDE